MSPAEVYLSKAKQKTSWQESFSELLQLAIYRTPIDPLFLQLAESLRAAILILYKNLTRTRVCVCAVKPFSI